MRTGPIAGEEVALEAGSTFALVDGDLDGDVRRVSTSVDNLAQVVEQGDEIYLADGEIVLRVTGIDGSDVVTEVLRGGVLRSRKGMHIPGAERRVNAFTGGDRAALEATLELKSDWIGLSFVRDDVDVKSVKSLLPRRGHRPLVIAKIETRAAVEHLEAIIDAADGVMIARGDLGIQMPITTVPLLQKEIIHACNRAGKPVITATQMLESMTRSPLPTRAEVADIANAVVDGTDALMLSEETAVGDYPVEAVKTMAQTALRAEAWPSERDTPVQSELIDDPVSWAAAHAAVQAAIDVDAAAIVCPTRSGSTPARVAAFRPPMPIIGLSKRREVIGALSMLWGVTPVMADVTSDPKEAREDVEQALACIGRAGLIRPGDLVVVVAGSPGPRAGRTDYMRVVRA
jgi:pyruvate kinase